jgi:uncharacterized SAM-binding protein YcdF (DUF218 family)
MIKKQKTTHWLRIFLFVLGLVLTVYSCILLNINNINLGNLLPGLLGLPLLIYGIFALPLNHWFTHGLGKIVKWIFFVGYLFLACVFAVFGILMNIAAQAEPPQGADVVLVLGAALRGTEPSDTLARRLDTAIAYAEKNPKALLVVSGGQGPQEEIPEAHAMKQYLIEHGIPENRILVEDASTSTHENFVNSKILLDQYFGENAYTTVFVTNDYHILRAGINAKEAGITNAYGLPYRTLWYTAPPAYMRESLALLATYVLGAEVT